MGAEAGYRKMLRRIFSDHWSEVYETRSGSGLGYPDLQFLVQKRLIGVEVKVGMIGDKGTDIAMLYPQEIRGTQISWHDKFMKAGGKSYIVVCCGGPGAKTKFEAWAIPSVAREVTSKWLDGYPLSQCIQWVDRGQPVIDLADLK